MTEPFTIDRRRLLRMSALGGAGLIVSVVKNADEKNLMGLARDVQDLTARARNAQLTPNDVVGHASNPAFDAATFEIWGPLLNGGRIVRRARSPTRGPVRFSSDRRPCPSERSERMISLNCSAGRLFMSRSLCLPSSDHAASALMRFPRTHCSQPSSSRLSSSSAVACCSKSATNRSPTRSDVPDSMRV